MEPTRTTALLVFESMFGNTRTIADAVRRGLELGGVDVAEHDVTELGAATPAADVTVVGGPTHALSLSSARTRRDAVQHGAAARPAGPGLREWLDDHLPDARPGGCFAAFDTRSSKVGRLPLSAASAIARRARQHGYTVLDHPAGFLVEDLDGPLLPGEVERAVAWGRHVAETAQDHLAAVAVQASRA